MEFSVFKLSGYLQRPRAMGKMSLTSCRALSTPGKFSNVDRYEVIIGTNVLQHIPSWERVIADKVHKGKQSSLSRMLDNVIIY